MRHRTWLAAAACAVGVLFITAANAQDRRRSERAPIDGREPAQNSPAHVTSADVDAAINRAKAYLYAQQRNGNWEVSQQKQLSAAGAGRAAAALGWAARRN